MSAGLVGEHYTVDFDPGCAMSVRRVFDRIAGGPGLVSVLVNIQISIQTLPSMRFRWHSAGVKSRCWAASLPAQPSLLLPPPQHLLGEDSHPRQQGESCSVADFFTDSVTAKYLSMAGGPIVLVHQLPISPRCRWAECNFLSDLKILTRHRPPSPNTARRRGTIRSVSDDDRNVAVSQRYAALNQERVGRPAEGIRRSRSARISEASAIWSPAPHRRSDNGRRRIRRLVSGLTCR
jgi:hypothetical protein